ncbi:hypothetical protein BIW11_14122 [Tropilaelaps mercedesae]|uniref:Uncharacterized protein n=1 Tax=Tropilaelaps mercedesae TaxID=418985 RepID=A0A1V9WZ92_9ACAR|nr:hypothetical protein BIW11_14122 [Tropilaelaps mercedesae]
MSKCRSGSESRLSKLRSCESLTNTSKKVPSKVQYVSSILEPKDTKDVTMIKVKFRRYIGRPPSSDERRFANCARSFNGVCPHRQRGGSFDLSPFDVYTTTKSIHVSLVHEMTAGVRPGERSGVAGGVHCEATNLKIRMISGMPNSTEDESNVTALITEVSPNFAPTTVKLPQYQHEEGNRFSIAPTSNEPRPTDEVSMNRLTEDLRVTIFALSGKSTSQRFTQTKPNND